MLKDMLRAIVLDFGVSLNHYLPLVEFAYNNNNQATIGMALYKAFYGQRSRSPIILLEVGEQKLLRSKMV